MNELDHRRHIVVVPAPIAEAPAASSTSAGRRRLPPLWMMYSATWRTSTTSE